MSAVWTSLGLVAHMAVIWFGTELLRSTLSGVGFGLVDRRAMATAGRSGTVPSVIAAPRRELTRAAQLAGGTVTVLVAVLGGLALRIAWWSRGNFDLVALALPIAAGTFLGTARSVRHYRAAMGVAKARQRHPRTEAGSGASAGASRRIPITELHTGRVPCPRCGTAIQLEAPGPVVLGASSLIEDCPGCEASVLIDTRTDPLYATLEAFDDLAALFTRVGTFPGPGGS